jgi:hypothetical protein
VEKIATPVDLVSNLNSIIADIQSSDQPSRVDLSKRLASLADKLAGTHVECKSHPLRPFVSGWFPDGIMIEVSFNAEYAWADTQDEAEAWLKATIKACEQGIQKVKKLTPKSHPA